MGMIRYIFFTWLPVAVAVTGVCALVHLSVQQNYRQSLNDPQIQMAEDAASALNNGADAKDVIAAGVPIAINESLQPWIALLDSKGTINATTYEEPANNINGDHLTGVYIISTGALINRAAPGGPEYKEITIPVGVLQSAAEGRGKDSTQPFENRITWQPMPGVRQAIVVVPVTDGRYKGDFVVAGRNMREVEDREGQLAFFVGAAWSFTLLVSLIAVVLKAYFGRRP